METAPNITDFSHEILCHILKYLPLREILSVAMLSKKMLAAVDMHLTLCKSIDFCQDAISGYMPSAITDDHLLTLLKKCPHLETVYGLHPVKIERRRLRKRAALTIPGIIEALSICFHLKAVETSDLRLFEAIMLHLPQLEIIGHFQNRDGSFPPQASQRLKLQPYPRISSLHLIGVEIPELTAMPHLQHLHLQCVRFTKLQPFRAFLAQNLKSFVMKHCIGPSVPQRYLSLIIALSSSPNLSHLELVRVPLLNGLFQRAVEDSYRHNGFVNLRTLVIAGCKGILEADLGHLMIVASKNLETLYIQPSLTRDSLFVSLSFAQCSFPVLRNLHLGYIDVLNSSGAWSNDALLSLGLAEVPDTPSSITDSGMRVISQLFPHIKTLSVSNCPHLMVMYQWMAEEDLEAWSKLTDLTLQKCHCLQLSSFVVFVSFLSNIQVIILHDMFREPPKGCSHVGLSAGTGLGMSSAVVSNQDEHIAVQGHHQEFEHPGDEENDENEREFIDIENEDNPEPQFMVLQGDFFDGEDDDDAVNLPIEEGQEPVVEQELYIPENQLNNDALLNENNNVIDSTSVLASADSKYDPPSTEFVSEKQIVDEHKYDLKQKDEEFSPSKVISVQRNVQSKGGSYNSDLIKEESIDSGTHNENGSNSNGAVNNCVETNSLHSNYVEIYDPHKPSTSKAGSHLEYSITYDAKICTVYDSDDDDYKSDAGVKRLKKCSDEQNISKKMKKSKISEDCKSSKAHSLSRNDNISFKNKENICCYTKSESCTVNGCDSIDQPCNTSRDFIKCYNFESQSIEHSSVKVEKQSSPVGDFSTVVDESKISVKNNCDSLIEFNDSLTNNSNKQESHKDVIHDDQKDCREINTYIKSEKSSTNLSCYVVVEKIKIQPDKILTHSSENEQKTEEKVSDVSTSNVYKNSCDISYGIKCEEASGEYCTVNRDECSCVIQTSNEIPSADSVRKDNSFNKSTDLFTNEKNEILVLKPCCVRLKKIDIITNDEKYVGDLNENHNKKPETNEIRVSNSEPDSCFFAENVEGDLCRKTSSENCEMYDACQPSTSKAENDIKSGNTRKNARNKYTASIVRKAPENKVKSNESSKMQNIKSASRNNNTDNMSHYDKDLTSPKSKKLRESNTFYSNDIHEVNEYMKYYILLANDRSPEIVNSLTGESCNLPNCCVPVTRIDENWYESQKGLKIKSKFRKKCTLKNSDVEESNHLEFNPYLPSTSKDESNCYLPEASETKCFKNKNCNFCKKSCNQSLKPKNVKERLHITNSDAMLFLKSCVTKKNCPCNTVQETPVEVITYDVCKVEDFPDQSCINQESKNEPSLQMNAVSELHSDVNEIVKNNSSYHGKETHKLGSLTKKRKRKRKNTIQKRSTKHLYNVKFRSSLGRDTRRAVPMISLISQGTQATSADIRRSVRLVRRASSRRRSVPPVRVSKNPYSSKISAKTLTKRPRYIHPPPDCLEKATSTSDPLLEDDAIQTLQIISETLLSFTVVSCGISDLIIDRCPKLIHIEVQACRILKKLQLNTCPAIKRINVSQCPKLNICALVTPIMSLTTDSYFLVSYEPCMQGYHPGEGEKAVLSRASLNQSVLLCHDFCNISHVSIQANFKEKILEWLHFLSQLHLYLNYKREKVKRKKLKSEAYKPQEYPWSHDLRKIHGQYSVSQSSDFCDNEGRYQLITNNPIFCDIFETNELDTGFPDVNYSDAFKDTSLISYELIEKYFQMQRKFVAFYIPITENNQIRF